MCWYLGGEAEALTYRTEGGRSRGRCVSVSVPSSAAATAAAISGPSHIKALTSLGFGWIRAWGQTCRSLSHGLSLGRPVLGCSLPTGGKETDLGQGQGLLDFLVVSDPPPHLSHRTSLHGLLSPHFLPAPPALPAAAAVTPRRPRVDRE